MMDVYLTYDRYEHNEWFYVYHIDTNYDSAYKSLIEEDLFSFISYGPDDCHSFQMVKISVSRSTYYKLRKWVNADELDGEEQDKFDKFMTKVYQNYFDCESLVFTDGQSDFFEIVQKVCGEEPIEEDYDSEEEYEKALTEYENLKDELYSVDEKFKEALRSHIANCY